MQGVASFRSKTNANVLLLGIFLNRRAGFDGSSAVPAGYELSWVGVLIFAFGGVGDLIWHTLFGIEANVAALLSPTHLILALGLGLIVTGPLRAAWRQRQSRLNWASGLPTLLSFTLLLSLLTFFTQYADPITHSYADQYGSEQVQELGIASILVQSAILMGVVLISVRRWRLPFGAFALMFALNDASKSLLADSSPVIAVAIIGGVSGLVVDILYRRLGGAAEPRSMHLFAFLVPVIVYAVYFAGLLAVQGIVWTVHLWVGSIVMAGLVGWLLSYILIPIREPETQSWAS